MKSNSEKIYCNYRELPKVVKPNDIIYIDDGKIVLLVTDCDPVSFILSFNYNKNGIHCEVKGGGLLGGKKAIKLPSGKQEVLPVLNHLDENDLIHYALKNSKLFHI